MDTQSLLPGFYYFVGLEKEMRKLHSVKNGVAFFHRKMDPTVVTMHTIDEVHLAPKTEAQTKWVMRELEESGAGI